MPIFLIIAPSKSSYETGKLIPTPESVVGRIDAETNQEADIILKKLRTDKAIPDNSIFRGFNARSISDDVREYALTTPFLNILSGENNQILSLSNDAEVDNDPKNACRVEAVNSYINYLKKMSLDEQIGNADDMLKHWFVFLDSKNMSWACVYVDYISEYLYSLKQLPHFRTLNPNYLLKWKAEANLRIAIIVDFYDYSIATLRTDNDITILMIQYMSKKRQFISYP